jgi:hypothetical protein
MDAPIANASWQVAVGCEGTRSAAAPIYFKRRRTFKGWDAHTAGGRLIGHYPEDGAEAAIRKLRLGEP